MRLTLNGEATGMPAQAEAAVLRVTSRLDADDGGALVRLLDLDRVVAVDQLPGQMTLSANGPLNGEIRVNASGLRRRLFRRGRRRLASARRWRADRQPAIKASAADLRPLQRAMTGQAGRQRCRFR